MGGNAFPLYTPRMSQDVYERVRKQCHAILIQHFCYVGTPIEGPGKTTYGDIDFLVAEPCDDILDTGIRNGLKTALGSVDCIETNTVSFALPWPDPTSGGATTPKSAAPISRDGDETIEGTRVSNATSEAASEQTFVQVDIQICGSKAAWEWGMFHHAHGDLWNILGTMIRPLGLTVNDKGLWLRIEDIELLDRKKSMVFLTSEPERVLDFLSLDKVRYGLPLGNVNMADIRERQRFQDAWQMYEYATTCRLFFILPTPGDEDDHHKSDSHLDTTSTLLPSLPQTNAYDNTIQQTNRSLKHNDRKRMAQRPLFTRWVEEFLPHCRQQVLEASKNHNATMTYRKNGHTREDVKFEALTYFSNSSDDTNSPNPATEYTSRLHAWRDARRRDEIWRTVIKGNVPTDGIDVHFRSATLAGLKKIVLEPLNVHGSRSAEFMDADGLLDKDLVKRFVVENWREVGARAWEAQLVRMREGMQAKRKRKGEQEKERALQQAGCEDERLEERTEVGKV